MNTEDRPRIVILGAGFPGPSEPGRGGWLWAARALASVPGEVLLLDRNNHRTFLPLLYQVAAAGLESEEIVQPVGSILRSVPYAIFALADVRGIDFTARQILTADRITPNDFFILAAGRAHPTTTAP